MAPTAILVIALSLAISTQSIIGMDIRCEDLDERSCAFSVSSSGKRCVLESRLRMSGMTAYTCGTSEIVADKIRNLVETDDCVRSCGVDRQALGISSDSLLDRRFAQSLCSRACYNNCPNIVDLYFNLAAGEGVFLPRFCKMRQSGARRGMIESIGFKSSRNAGQKQTFGPQSATAIDEEALGLESASLNEEAFAPESKYLYQADDGEIGSPSPY
ncbi:PAR1 protein [Striga hermonthica]|uniref:PAR1 protein n=1 Tax=Striga hermonthica TaxID=68872 RepID=A0A9N7MUH4_STRHE|nr:PAR1 protein [Striga hermonthica]